MFLRLCAFGLLATQMMPAQQFRTDGIATAPGDNIKIDLSSVSDVDGASITLRNSAAGPISLPQITNTETLWPYSADAIIQHIQPHGTDQEIAIQTWQYVLNHMSHGCSAGTMPLQGTTTFATDPVLLLNGFGFGCCDQADRVLAWLWQKLGYDTRLAIFDFHTVPEIYYDGAWHLLDPDHRVYYLSRDNITIASVEDILADPGLVARAADANGNDPLGTNAATMAAWFEQNAGNLRFISSGYLSDSGLSLVLRPHEQLRIDSKNRQDSVQLSPGALNFLSFRDVHSGRFDWDLSFGDPDWQTQVYSAEGVDIVADSSGANSLADISSSPGWIIYRESSMFPVTGLTIAAQISAASGSLQAYFSSDGIQWSDPIIFRSATDISSYQQAADLSTQAAGYYSYFVKIELQGNIHLHKLRISPLVQVSRFLFPSLATGTSNDFVYSDSSSSSQQREVHVITRIPQGNAIIRGMQAESLIAQDPFRSLAQDHSAANLVDGDLDSLAAPGAGHLDYRVQLNGLYAVTGISIDWNQFGTDARYVQNWSLFGREGNQDWRLLASGGFPGQNTSDIKIDCLVTDLRIVADGNNPIGVYEFRAFGRTVQELSISPVEIMHAGMDRPSVAVNVSNGSAFALISRPPPDGDPAGDPSFILEQQISFPAMTHVSAVQIDWGDFGMQPSGLISWAIVGRNGTSEPWTSLTEGVFPNATKTFLLMSFVGTDLRILATSAIPWPTRFVARLFGGKTLTNLAAFSSVPEIFTFPAANLVDQDTATPAYPGAIAFDYIVDPSQDTYIDAVQLVWDSFGSVPGFIDSWQLMGLPPNGGAWQVIAQGGSPAGKITIVSMGNSFRKLRIAAQSRTNFIGIFEMWVFGTRQEQAPAYSTTMSSTSGTVPATGAVRKTELGAFARKHADGSWLLKF